MDDRTATELLRKIREKRAELPLQDPGASARQDLSSAAAKASVPDVLWALGLGGGVGLTAAGLKGLYNTVHRNLTRKRPRLLGPNVLDLPYPAEKEAEEGAGVAGWLGNLLSGNYATDKSEVPWHGAAMVGAGALGAYGGYNLLGSQLSKMHEDAEEADLAAARDEFEKALVGQHPRGSRTAKLAADSGLSDALDGLYSAVEKCGGLEGALGSLLNAYGFYALPVAGLSAVAAYRASSKNQRRALLEKAMKQRERERFSQAPPEIFAVPSPR